MRSGRWLISLIFVAVVVLLNLPLPASMRVKTSARDGVSGAQNVWHLVVSGWSRTFSSIARAKSHISNEKSMLQDVANLEFRVA